MEVIVYDPRGTRTEDRTETEEDWPEELRQDIRSCTSHSCVAEWTTDLDQERTTCVSHTLPPTSIRCCDTSRGSEDPDFVSDSYGFCRVCAWWERRLRRCAACWPRWIACRS